MLETLEDIKIEFGKLIDVAAKTFPPSNRIIKAIEELAEFAEVSEDIGLYSKRHWDVSAQQGELVDCFVCAAILEKQFDILPEILHKYNQPFYMNDLAPSTIIKNLAKTLYQIFDSQSIGDHGIKSIAIYSVFCKNQTLILGGLNMSIVRKKYYQLVQALKDEGVTVEII